jgi:hypothetical protein
MPKEIHFLTGRLQKAEEIIAWSGSGDRRKAKGWQRWQPNCSRAQKVAVALPWDDKNLKIS